MSRNQSERKTTSSDSEDKQEYSKMTTASLKKLLEARKIEGRSKLTTKDAMIGALERFDNPEEEEEDEEKKEMEKEEESQIQYTKMNTASLKKLLENRGIEGRSRLTTKDAMIKVLEIFDQDPEDKAAISSLVAEVSTPRKNSSSGKKDKDSSSTKSISKDSSKSETSSEDSSEDKPKKKRTRKSKKGSDEDKKESKEEVSEEETSTGEDKVVSSMTRVILRHMKFMSRETQENQVLRESWIRQLTEIKKQLGLFDTTIPVDINDE
jgi:hypothetical protein